MNEYIKKKIRASNILKPFITENAETKQSGIYEFERRDEKGVEFFYVGQAVNVFERLVSHINGYDQRLDLSLRKRGLKSLTNPYGWDVRVLEYCNREELNEKETQHIYDEIFAGKQTYNSTYGSQGEGKQGIKENKPSKGYYDGVAQGYENARREIAHLFELHLTAVQKSAKPNKNQEKALSKFYDFLADKKAKKGG